MGMYNLHQDGATVQGGHVDHVGFSLGACSQPGSRNGQSTVSGTNFDTTFCLTGWKSRCQKCANSDQNRSPQGVKDHSERGRTRGEVNWGTLEMK